MALRVYRQMLRVPCTPNCFTYGSLIRALGRAKDWKGAMHLFEVCGPCSATLVSRFDVVLVACMLQLMVTVCSHQRHLIL